MSDQKPLLSICIPTYNRSSFLRVMLQALLPQVAECGDQVEVWVIDNASPDETPAVVEESRALGPFHYCRNESNIGPLLNVLKGPCELATGEFVWVLGDHNLMMPGALSRIILELRSHPQFRLFYANFNCARYPEHWPDLAINGFSGTTEYIANPDLENSEISQWHELLRPYSALCTQVYAHIVQTSIWTSYWRNRNFGDAHSCSLTTYPHTQMIAESCFYEPTYYLGAPAITIFNGAQSWSQLKTQLNVYCYGLPQLILLFGALGCSAEQVARFEEEFAVPVTREVLLRSCKHAGVAATVRDVLSSCRAGSYVRRTLRRVVLEYTFPGVNNTVQHARRWFMSRHQWWLYNCRPVRWFRAWSKRSSISSTSH